MKILVFGEILWDIFNKKRVIGGAPFNFAAHFTKNGGEAYLASAIGNDALGKETLNEVNKNGVKTDFITVNENETGKCIVTLDEDGFPSYNLLDDVAYDYIDVSGTLKEGFDVLYFGTLSLRSKENLAQIKKLVSSGNFGDIFVDLNIRQPFSKEKAINFGVENATVLKISDEELDFVNDIVFGEKLSINESLEKFISKYPNIKVIVVTMGAKGTLAFERKSNKTYKIYSKKVEAVSTVGAGDSFFATFAYNYLLTGDMYSSLEIATRVSAFVVINTEAIPDYNVEEIRIKPFELNKYEEATDEIRISRMFSNGMVFQAGKEIRIFGEGKGKVAVELNSVKGITESDGGKWLIILPAQNYGGPYTLRVDLNGNAKEFNDVWLGDVYLVAGQSNIRYNLRHAGVDPATYEETEQLRIFGTNEDDIGAFTFDEGWCTLQKSNAHRFSAVGYYMGLDLVNKSEHKVGLIICSQGAGIIQAFLPEGYLDNTDCFIPEDERSEGYKNPLYTWNKDGTLYNAKFSKMIPFNVRALVWYQGEGNTTGKDYTIYDKLLSRLIEKWRIDLMDTNLPVIIVQLANYKTASREGWSMVQDMQEKAAKTIKNAHLVKCADICEDNDIHPPTKNLLGARLADKIREIFG